MIFAKIESYEEIVKKLDKKEDKIAIISCNTCARTCGNGGLNKLNELGFRLIRDGFNVTDEEKNHFDFMSQYIFKNIEMTDHIDYLIKKYAQHEYLVKDLIEFKKKHSWIREEK